MRGFIVTTALLLSFTVAGCADIATAVKAKQAVATVQTAVMTVQSDAPAMTKAEKAACGGQAALNVLTDYLTSHGNVKAAGWSSWGSTMAGAGCEWRE